MRSSLAIALSLACSLSCGLPAQGALTGPCLSNSLGTNLGLDDDGVAEDLALGFAFPVPGGTTATEIDVCANGFVWLAPNGDDGCCDANVLDFLADDPRIAVLWTDLDPSAGGGVWFQTVAAGAGLPAHAIITWQNVPEFGESLGMTMQLQMYADGSFSISYDARADVITHTALVGVTEGLGATANGIDLISATAATPHNSGSHATVHELHAFAFDVPGNAYAFVPNGQGGYLVHNRATCTFASVVEFGAGCPKPALAYEWFSQGNSIDLSNASIEFTPAVSGGYIASPSATFFTGYSSPIYLSDDHVLPANLPFAFPYAGGAGPGSSTTSIGICSNGFAWLQPGISDARCCDGDVLTFHSDPESIAFLWQDLDPSLGGNCYFDVTATEAHITFVNVPEYGTGNLNTAQLTLRQNGSFRIAWQNVSNLDHDCVVGFSGGGIGGLLPPVDFNAGPSVSGSGGTPVHLYAGVGALPKLGATLPLWTDEIPNNPTWTLMLLGTTAYVPSQPLGTLGVTGCELHVALNSVQFFAYSGNPSGFPLTIPNSPFLIGYRLFAQSAIYAPSLNIGGFISSNALAITIGL